MTATISPKSAETALPSLSLVVPAYNESTRVLSSLRAAWNYLAAQDYEYELLIVDDGSTDNTAELGRTFAKTHANVRILTIPHGGKAAALRSGMKNASGDLIAFSDADLATPIAYLGDFRVAIDEGSDIVIGSREGAGSQRIAEPGYRHFMGRVFNLLVRILLLPGIQDTQCGFKMFRRAAANEILDNALLYKDYGSVVAGPRVTAFDVELLVVAKRLGYQVRVIPVVWTYGSQSKVSPVRDTLNNFSDVLRVKWNDLLGRYRRR